MKTSQQWKSVAIWPVNRPDGFPVETHDYHDTEDQAIAVVKALHSGGVVVDGSALFPIESWHEKRNGDLICNT